MATELQKRAVAKVVETGGNVSKAMIAAGYSENTAHTPSKLTESQGFKEELEKYGLTHQFITEALVADIKAKPAKRFFELNLGAEILGMKQNKEQESTKTLIIAITGETATRYAITQSSS